jgi:hypothetical protein
MEMKQPREGRKRQFISWVNGRSANISKYPTAEEPTNDCENETAGEISNLVKNEKFCRTTVFSLVVKGPAADATDAPQP